MASKTPALKPLLPDALAPGAEDGVTSSLSFFNFFVICYFSVLFLFPFVFVIVLPRIYTATLRTMSDFVWERYLSIVNKTSKFLRYVSIQILRFTLPYRKNFIFALARHTYFNEIPVEEAENDITRSIRF